MSFLRTTTPVDTLYSVGLDIGKSFEEIRCDDYLKHYRTTGRLPPPPVPQEPSSAALRQAQGLPPLFQPFVPPADGGSSSSTSTTLGGTLSPPAIVDPQKLPPGQSFKTTAVERDNSSIVHGPTLLKTDTYFSISAMPEYSKFSFEELRYYAYWHGRKQAPPDVAMHPFERTPSAPSSSSLTSSTLTPGENMQTFTMKEGYQQHSLEEHRLAWMSLGRPARDIPSAELFGNPRPPQPSLGGGGGFSGASTLSTSRPLGLTQSSPNLFGSSSSVRPW